MITRRTKALLIGVGRPELPWWWRHVDHEALECELEYRELPLVGGRPRTPFSWSFVQLCWRATRMLLRARRDGFAYVFTFENDWLTFITAGLQTLLGIRRPRHVIVQFIMRELTNDVRSRLKYAFMRWCFRSVFLCICSSRPELTYYRNVFGWPASKLAFVPFHTDPAFLSRPRVERGPMILAAGRTFRDYATLIDAVTGTDLEVTIVAGRSSLSAATVPSNVQLRYDLPLPELMAMMSACHVVVVPLESREISTGQSVVLEAMALGKPVVATRVAGTVDYIDHGRTGFLVPPRDGSALRQVMMQLCRDAATRRVIGEAGRAEVEARFLPNHYAQGVARALEAAQ